MLTFADIIAKASASQTATKIPGQRGKQVGAISQRKDGQYQKQADGTWKKISSDGTRASKTDEEKTVNRKIGAISKNIKKLEEKLVALQQALKNLDESGKPAGETREDRIKLLQKTEEIVRKRNASKETLADLAKKKEEFAEKRRGQNIARERARLRAQERQDVDQIKERITALEEIQPRVSPDTSTITRNYGVMRNVLAREWSEKNEEATLVALQIRDVERQIEAAGGSEELSQQADELNSQFMSLSENIAQIELQMERLNSARIAAIYENVRAQYSDRQDPEAQVEAPEEPPSMEQLVELVDVEDPEEGQAPEGADAPDDPEQDAVEPEEEDEKPESKDRSEYGFLREEVINDDLSSEIRVLGDAELSKVVSQIKNLGRINPLKANAYARKMSSDDLERLRFDIGVITEQEKSRPKTLESQRLFAFAMDRASSELRRRRRKAERVQVINGVTPEDYAGPLSLVKNSEENVRRDRREQRVNSNYALVNADGKFVASGSDPESLIRWVFDQAKDSGYLDPDGQYKPPSLKQGAGIGTYNGPYPGKSKSEKRRREAIESRLLSQLDASKSLGAMDQMLIAETPSEWSKAILQKSSFDAWYHEVMSK